MALQTEPEGLVVGDTSHGRSTDKFGTFKAGSGIATIVEIEILRTGFTPHRQAFGTGSGNGMQGIGTTDMYDVEWCFGKGCQRNGALGGFSLQDRGTGQCVKTRSGMTC